MFGRKKQKSTESKTVTRYTANIELPNGERWAETETGLTKSGRWTDKVLYLSKKRAQSAAEKIAAIHGQGAKPFTSSHTVNKAATLSTTKKKRSKK